MTDLKAAARAGDIQAIAKLMNASFGPKGISVKIAKSGAVLKVLMESDRLPDRKLAGAVRKGLDGIKPAGVEKVFLKAQSNGGEDSWSEQWSLIHPQPVMETKTAEPTEGQSSPQKPRKGNQSGKQSISKPVQYVLAVFGVLVAGALVWGTYADITQPASEVEEATKGINESLQRLEEAKREAERESSEASANQNAIPSQTPTLSQLSQKAGQFKLGMTYQEVVALLGRLPDTVANDQIRQELGESVQGNNLVAFDWKNDDPNCHPVSAQFDPSDMTLTGWSEGRVCTGPSIFNEPFGKPCAETTLCDPAKRSTPQ